MYTEIDSKTIPTGNVTRQTFKVVSGADGNLMPITMFAKLFPKISLKTLDRTIESSVNLYAYNNIPIKQFGICSVHLNFKGRPAICKFYVVKHSTAILGICDSEKLGLVKVNFYTVDRSIKVVHDVTSDSFRRRIESEYPELFKGIILMDGEISIKLKEGTIPHVKPIRHVSHAMQEPLKKELNKLVDEKILHKVDIADPIEWLSSFVHVKKPNGKIRLCLDLTLLNIWIIHPRHSAKLVDDIIQGLNGAQFFTVVDTTNSFFNHKLDEESSKLTTFETPYGHYRYLRMAMGAILSSDVYQYKVDGHFEEINHCVAIAENIIIYGLESVDSDHDKTVRQVVEKARKVGMRFNSTKCQFHQTQVNFSDRC